MLTILLTIAIAGRLKSLRVALAIAFILPLPILFLGAPPAALLLRIPANLLAAFLSFKYYQRKRGDQNLDTCREKILANILTIQQAANTKIESGGDDIWLMLGVDSTISKEVIKDNPDNIPVMLAALMRVGSSLGAVIESPALDKSETKSLRRAQNKYFNNLKHVSKRLLEIHGHKITDSEAQVGAGVIDSYKWDEKRQEFNNQQ